jgi:hypothetical protein
MRAVGAQLQVSAKERTGKEREMDGERSFFAVLPLLETKMRNGHRQILTKKKR